MVAEVPFLDCVGAMLDPHLPLTLTDREEFGDPNDPRVFDYQMTYSPYDTVRAQNYPHVLLIGGYKSFLRVCALSLSLTVTDTTTREYSSGSR